MSCAPFHSNKDSITRSWLIWANCLTMRRNYFWRGFFYFSSFYKMSLDTKAKNFFFLHDHYFICQFARNSWVIIYLSMQCDRNYSLLLIYQAFAHPIFWRTRGTENQMIVNHRPIHVLNHNTFISVAIAFLQTGISKVSSLAKNKFSAFIATLRHQTG